MRTDYFDDLLPDYVTHVTQRNRECVTLEKKQNNHKNNELEKSLPALPTLPKKKVSLEKNTIKPLRHAYRFRLHNGEGGGTYLTDAVTLTAARSELLEVYSRRLALVTHA